MATTATRVMSDDASVLVRALYESRRFDFGENHFYFEGPMVDLVQRMEQIARARGLTLSRWQANKPGRRVVVTWMLHGGDRADQARYQKDVVESAVMHQIEGRTERCNAYQALSDMLERMSIAQDRTPMVADVLRVMHEQDVEQDEAVRILGGLP